MRFIHIILFVSIFSCLSCNKETFRGSGSYKQTKKSQQSENYLETQAEKVADKSKKRNKKLEKKKKNANEQAKQLEIAKAAAGKKNKKKKKNTGKFQFY